MKDRHNKSRRGQTLVEALVALSLLTTGFIGIANLLTRSFLLSRTTSNDTQATYLASEGIEVAKNLIDHDVYEGLKAGAGNNDWGQCFGLGDGESAHYNLEYDTTSCPTPLPGTSTDPLYFDPDSHLYSYKTNGNVETNFIRDVYVTDLGNEIDVQSTVTWTDGSLSNTITLEDQFYNWHPING